MSTRSIISVQRNDGTVAAVYCHHDGYPEHVGKILAVDYSAPGYAEELISYGNMSSLASSILDTVFYVRDRDESIASQCATVYQSLDEMLADHESYGAEYIYTFDEDQAVWFAMKLTRDGKLEPIEF